MVDDVQSGMPQGRVGLDEIAQGETATHLTLDAN
jgi:hypothetical protein